MTGPDGPRWRLLFIVSSVVGAATAALAWTIADEPITIQAGVWVARPDRSYVCRVHSTVYVTRRSTMLSPYFWLVVCDDWEDEKPTDRRPKWLRRSMRGVQVHTDGGWL